MTRSALAILPGVGMPEHRFRIGQPRGWSLGRGDALLARHERGGARQVVAFDPAFMRAVATPPASWHSARRLWRQWQGTIRTPALQTSPLSSTTRRSLRNVAPGARTNRVR